MMRRQISAVVLLALLVLVPPLLAGTYLVTKYRWAENRLAEVEPRFARLQGLAASRTELAQAITASTALVSRFVYPASLDVSQAGNEAQQRIRDVIGSAGLSLVSSQVLAPKTGTHFDRVPLAVRLEGELPALQAALVVLTSQAPSIHFESFSVQAVGNVKADTPQRLAIQFNVFVLRAKT